MDTLENRLQKRIHVSLYALLFLTALLGISVLLEGCSDSCEVEYEYTYFEPVYTSLAEIRSGVKVTAPRSLSGLGKIYYKDDYLFVNEPGKGIHVINNKSPENPKQLSFIEIPGNYDLSIMDSYLYADSYVDLVVLDISSLTSVKEVKRLQGVFSEYNTFGFSVDPEKGVVSGWQEVEIVNVSSCDNQIQQWGGFYFEKGIAFAGADVNMSAAFAPGNGSGPGVGGSMARFTIANDHLYVMDMGSIESYDLSNAANPVSKASIDVSWDIETLFPAGQHLFVGASSGMYIVDISQPEAPWLVSTYSHVNSCDPVVVDDTYAYVTLRSGNACQGFENQLEVIDIRDVTAPKLVKTYPMYNPHGLGKDNETLFICDGDEGLKVYGANDVHAIDKNLLAHYGDIHAYDVIPFNDVLMMIGADGIHQYDYSNPSQIKKLSSIRVNAD